MNDLISKASVCEILSDIYPMDGERVVEVEKIDKAYDAVLGLPETEERKKGKWEVTSFYTKCSECGESFPIIPQNFCPNCGADMRGGDNETD